MAAGNFGIARSGDRDAWTASNTSSDPEGWVYWMDCLPPTDVEVEIKRDGEDGTHLMIPRKMSLGWNTDGVWWRWPRS